MVISSIDPTIFHTERRNISLADMDADMPVFEVVMFDKSISIAVGRMSEAPKRSIQTRPIYLIDESMTPNLIQIGVFEFDTMGKGGNGGFDDTGTIDISTFGEPLLYSYAQKTIQRIRTLQMNDANETSKPSTTIGGSRKKSRKKSPKRNPVQPFQPIPISLSIKEIVRRCETLPIQSQTVCDDERVHTKPLAKQRRIGKAMREGNWISILLNNRNLSSIEPKRLNNVMITTHDTADCISYAIGVINPRGPSSTDIRTAVSRAIDPSLFARDLEIYNKYQPMATKLIEIKSKLSADNKEMRREFAATEDTRQHEQLVGRAKSNRVKFDDLGLYETYVDRAAVLLDLPRYEVHQNTDSLSDSIVLRDVQFGRRENSAMARLYGIDIIIFSLDENKQTDTGYSVCRVSGTSNHSPEPTEPLSRPIVILSFDGTNYKCIAYKGVSMFMPENMPWAVSRAIERYDAYTRIETPETTDEILSRETDTVFVCDSGASLGEIPGFDTGESTDRSILFNNQDLTDGTTIPYLPLLQTPDWRHRLADTWLSDIKYDGKTWTSVSHYMVAQMFKSSPEYYNVFHKDGGTDVSHAVSLLARHVESIPKSIKREKPPPRDAIVKEKMKQHPPLLRLLCATGRAIIMTGTQTPPHPTEYCNPPSPPTIDSVLMSIRAEMDIG